DADPLAVFAPRPVRVVVDISRQIAADYTGTPGIERLRRILDRVPVLEIGRDHESKSLPVRPPKRLALGDRHKLVMHGSDSRPLEHLAHRICANAARLQARALANHSSGDAGPRLRGR